MLTKPLMTMYIKINLIPIPIFLCAKRKKEKETFCTIYYSKFSLHHGK